MSARLSIAGFLLAALLFSRGPVVQAKPPDLPVVKPVVCTPAAPMGDEGSFPVVLEVREEADTHSQAQAEASKRTLTRCLLFAAHPLLSLLPLEELFAEAEEKADVVVESSSGQAEEEVSVNLKKLLNAEETYRRAEDCRRQGYFDEAAALYGVVRRLCPGSRFDWMAEGRLRQMVAEHPPARTDTGAEEQDIVPAAKPASTCPYLQNKRLELCPPVPGTVPEPASALDNLNKLERAEQLYRIAESLRRYGQTSDAIATYEAIRTLCPGSRYDEMASERVHALHAEEAENEEFRDILEMVEKTGTGQKLPVEPEELRQRLRCPINLYVEDMPLIKVLDELRVLTPQGLSIKVDQSVIESEGLTLEHPVTMKLELVSVKSALNLLLQRTNLVYRLKDGAVFITTPARTGDPVSTRRYAVTDLFAPDAAPVVEALQKNLYSRVEGVESMSPFCRMIVEMTDGPNWSSRVGSGAMAFDPKSQELVVRQTAEMHRQVEECLAAIRREIERERSKGSEEESSTPAKKDQSSSPSKPHGVSKLLEACQLALHQGHYAQADTLARQALAIDVEAVEAHPLVYKMHLFDQLRRVARAQALRQPELPPVDPLLGRTMEQVQREARSSGLILEIEASGGEEQEAAVRPTEETRLFVKPAPSDLFVSERGATAQAGWSQLLLGMLKPGNCVEWDLTNEGARVRFQFDLGSTGMRLTWERGGQPSLLIWTYGGSETGADR